MTFNRSAIKVGICLIALANVQCGGDRREIEVDSGTLTIHVADQDERVLGPLGAYPSSPKTSSALQLLTF